MADLTEDSALTIVREEIEASSAITDMQQEMRRQVVVLERVNDKLDTVIDMLTDNLKVTGQFAGHEERLAHLQA